MRCIKISPLPSCKWLTYYQSGLIEGRIGGGQGTTLREVLQHNTVEVGTEMFQRSKSSCANAYMQRNWESLPSSSSMHLRWSVTKFPQRRKKLHTAKGRQNHGNATSIVELIQSLWSFHPVLKLERAHLENLAVEDCLHPKTFRRVQI